MYVCMYVCMHACMYVCMYVHMHRSDRVEGLRLKDLSTYMGGTEVLGWHQRAPVGAVAKIGSSTA